MSYKWPVVPWYQVPEHSRTLHPPKSQGASVPCLTGASGPCLTEASGPCLAGASGPCLTGASGPPQAPLGEAGNRGVPSFHSHPFPGRGSSPRGPNPAPGPHSLCATTGSRGSSLLQAGGQYRPRGRPFDDSVLNEKRKKLGSYAWLCHDRCTRDLCMGRVPVQVLRNLHRLAAH